MFNSKAGEKLQKEVDKAMFYVHVFRMAERMRIPFSHAGDKHKYYEQLLVMGRDHGIYPFWSKAKEKKAQDYLEELAERLQD